MTKVLYLHDAYIYIGNQRDEIDVEALLLRLKIPVTFHFTFTLLGDKLQPRLD